MSIEAPTADFTGILDDLGQPITIRSVSRTLDNNGVVTSSSTSDVSLNAVVQEVSYKEKIYLQMGLVNIGDVMFFVAPNTNLTIYDMIIWNTETYRIRKILLPPRVDATLIFKQVLTVKDSP